MSHADHPDDGPPLRVLAVIPARGGSKGLPRKNIRPLAGLPLIGHSLRCADLVACVARCVVTTDDAEIADVARSLGGDVPFMRPDELANDSAPMAPVIRHALETVEALEREIDPAAPGYDAVLLLDPTSPARLPAQIDEAAARLAAEPGLDGVIAVSEPFFNPTWVGVKEVDGVMQRYFPEVAGVVRRQDVDRFLRVNGNFYLWTADFVRRLERSWMDEGRFGVYEVPETQAFSIDDEREFRLIEALVGAGLVPTPWLDAVNEGADA